ncbi:hypothetical protein SPBR_06033 [Sporothrix brasiliensis 5110]|uniref:Rhodopsin domain-containing protein n=1 Tax=Sporothrix brasiliensis 5110 TaxID=1398154 RepID=A0A0C2F4N8_9PEZI|nr:uncharacterized protein SPBR_06033 [Sporothrix brasiliensis 5110]KIH93894.1 hypothetical protein SPBR_06033 [Sporothrix brasiliensis 5110]
MSHIPGENPALDAETRVPILIGTAVAFSIASSLVVMLRMYTRHAIVRAPGLDDYTMVVAAVLALGVTVSTIVQAQHGLGRHAWLVTDAATTMVQLKALFAGEVLYNLSQICTKVAFLLQYRRIFRDALYGHTRAVCFWLILFLLAWGVTQEFLVAFACIPVSLFVPSMAATCIESLVVWYLTSIMNIVTDFVLFLVPIPAVRQLRLPLRQKALVMSLFCLGFFTCIISMVRLFTLHAALNSTDGTWDNAPTSWWTTIELNCGILCASIATLRPLIRALTGRPATKMSGSGGVSGGGGGSSSTSRARSSVRKGAYPLHDLPTINDNESQSGLNLKDDEDAVVFDSGSGRRSMTAASDDFAETRLRGESR